MRQMSKDMIEPHGFGRSTFSKAEIRGGMGHRGGREIMTNGRGHVFMENKSK